MGRWLALLSTAAVIIAVAAIDPCKRQPFRGRCPSVGGAPPKRSQFVLRYYARNGECVSYPYGHCATDESEPQLYRYKEECEDSCINNTPANLGQPKSASEDNQTYGTPSPTKENPVAAGQRIFTPIQSKEPVIEKETTVTAPPTTVTTTDSTTTVTTTEATTTAQKVTITEEPTTTKVTIITTEATTESPTTTTHATTQSVTETTEGEEEEVEEQEEVQETTAPAPTTSKSTVTTASSARTECERRREASSSSKIRGGFVPVCDANGNFQKAQCEPDGRQCFCVNTSGIEITNSRTRNGVRPDCARIETAVAPKIQSCTGRPDRGPCSSSYTRYYYDEYTQRCTTFSYSGCGGTGNNYETDSECSTRCVPTKPPVVTTVAPTTSQHNDICLLPKERGPCDKYELRFYFNGETKECKYFFWGGCEGNGNNFETAEQCQSQCGVGKVSQHNLARTVSQTNGAIKTIPGVRIGNGTATTGSLPEIETAAPTTSATTTTQAPRTAPPTVPTTRFVPQTVQTRAPVPVQTQPPQTRFVPQTTAAPQPPPTATPVAPPRPPPVNLPGDSEESDVNRCDHPVDSGSCRGQFVRWFWDNNKQACDVFTYSGCEGNGNNFANREECMAICQRELPPPPQPPKDFSNVCKHEIDSGECQGVFQRFAFDTEEGECRPFTYGGCGGNGNNFATIAECRSNCEKPASQTVNVCEFDIEAGECTGVFPRFAYDRETNDCRPFTYGGCGGNGNNFATVNECRNICIKKTCNPIGQCDLSHCQVLTDSRGCRFCSCAPVKVPTPLQCPTIDVNRCLEPCIVMTNRRGCQECACPAQPSTLQPPVVLSRVPSPPAPSTQQPRPPGLPTRIEPPSAPSRPGENLRTIPGVEPNKSLLPADFAEDIQEKCLQPMATGPCKSFTDRWFFNKEDGSCHPFKYGGCAGNRNHFFTQRECQIHCARFLHPLETNELTTSTSHEHDARDSLQEITGTRARLGQRKALAFDLPSIIRGHQSLQVEPNAHTAQPETYETQAPIKIDLDKPLTTPRNENYEESTTRIANRLRTEPAPKVSLPVEEYTQTIITTRVPLNESPVDKIEEEEERQDLVKRPEIRKKVPVRQEAVRTQTVGSSPLSPQHTYTMHAVSNYDPQQNSNLEGLSPPVDPTYFTYNSQHLGQKKQFAVNNVPFDKNAPNPAGFVPLARRPEVSQSEAERRFESALASGNAFPEQRFNPVGFQSAGTQLIGSNNAPVQTNPQFAQKFTQQQQQLFLQRNAAVNQQDNFSVNSPVNRFNAPSLVAPQRVPEDVRQQFARNPHSAAPMPVRTAPPLAQEVRPQPVAQSVLITPPPRSTTTEWQSNAPNLSSQNIGRRNNQFVPNTTGRSSTNEETREPVKFIPSQRNTVSNFVPTTRQPPKQVEPVFAPDRAFRAPPQQPRFVPEQFTPDEPVQPATSRTKPPQPTTRTVQMFTTEAPRPTLGRNTATQRVQAESFIEPIRQVFQPVQNAVRTVVTQEKQHLNPLPIHKIEHTILMEPKRIQFKEKELEDKVPIIHGIRNGPYGQTHWVYYDGDYYGPLIPGVKANRTAIEKIDATVAVKEDLARKAAYESFQRNADSFQSSLDQYIKQKEQEQAKRERGTVAPTTAHTPFSRHPQGVVMIPVGSGQDEKMIPVVRTENIRFKDTRKTFAGNDQKLTKDAKKGEASAEDSFEDQEPVRRPVAHGVSHVRVVEPLPVENYQSPEPALRGSYGKKYLEPVTTQGVKITSTARSTTTTTTPTTTTVRTTTKIQEKDESVEEEEPQEITTVSVPSSSTSTTTEVPKKEDKPVEVNETEESSAQEPQESQVEQQPQEAKRFEAQSEQTAPETKEKDEPEAIAETSTELPASRAARLLEQAGKNEKEPEKTEEEEEEEVDETDETAVFTDGTTTEKATDPATATEKPTVGTTLLNEISSMEGEEGVEENEITPSSMMSSSKFAVHRQTEEAQKFEEITADLAGSPVKEVNTARPGLIRVEITRPPTLPSTAPAPTAESAPETAATQAESAATEESTTAEASPSPSTQTKTQNIEITDSTSSVSSPATTQVPSTASTTQSRPVTTASDSDDNEPTFDLNSIKSNINPRVEGVVQQPTEAVINPAVGVGREPVPRVPLLPAVQAIDPKKLDLEEPTTIFPTTKAVPTVSQTLAPARASQSTIAQSNKPFNSRDPKIVCSMPAEQGLCNSYVARWFFNYQTAQCEEFSFGGCGGNANNFVNRTLCELTCRSLHPSVTTLVPERCSYDKDAGEGRGYNVKWYFNMRNLRCEQFVYEGKGGNDNKFETLSDCERFCSPQPARPASSRPAPITPATVLPTKAETLRPASLPVAPSVIAPTFNKPLPGAPAPIAPTAAPKANPLVPLPATNEDSEDQEDTEDTEYSSDDEDPTMGPMPPLANRAQLSSHGPNELVPTPEPPATEPHPPSARGSKLEIVDRPHPVPVQPTVAFTTAAPTTAKATETPTTPSPTYNAKKIDNSDMVPREPNLGIVGPSPKEDVNYQTGQQPKASGIQTFDEKRLPPPDLDAKNEDDKVIRPSCPNGNKELHYSDGRPVMCLPGKAQCPDKAMCYFNGMDYFCCPNEEDPYDRHIFGGYGGDEARYGYKVFGPLRISRLMDEVPLRAKRQTTMDRAFNTNQASFNIDSVTAPLRFDAEKPRHVSSASRMRKPVPPKHGNPMCILPLVKGDCGAAHLRYYYDRNSDSCRLFYYSGCQGNANNFGSLSDCQRLCVLNGQVAPAVQADAVTPVTIIAPGQCPTGSPLGGNAPVLCGNSTDSIGCPTGFYCRGGPPDICCPGVDPAIRVVQHGVKLLPETTPLPGVPRSYYKQQLLATPRYMCPDASDPLMAENGSPAVCGAGFDFKMCPKGYYCAIDGAKGSRLCCPLFGSTASRIPHEYNVIPNSPLKASSTSREVSDREAIPRDQARYDQEQQKELIQHPATTTEEPEEEEYEDDDAAQQLRLKNDSHNSELQQNAAAESPKAADVSAEVVNIDIPKEEPAVEESTQPTETVKKPVSDKSVCLMKPTEGRACREDEKAPRTNLHYFYSAKDRRCKLYFYRGCGGNDNRFEKKGDCEALCLSV